MDTHVTPFYAAILAMLYLALSVRTLRLRRGLHIPIGDSGDPRMLRAMRVHANFAEYVPFALLLIYMVELQGAHQALIHILCACLLAGRLSHAVGVSRTEEDYRYRVFGMAMTFASFAVSIAALIAMAALRLGS